MTPAERLRQIEKISQNARTTWFGLLALLVFVGVTLMGHKDSDFFAYGAATQLPLVNVSVPPEAFFFAAPVLVAALYIYLQIYLQALWRALAKAPARIDGDPLDERIYPSVLGSAALILRRWTRDEHAKPVEGRGFKTFLVGISMTWVAAPLVMALLWWRSWPYHEEWLTLWIGLCLWFALLAGIASFYLLLHSMKEGAWNPARGTWRRRVSLASQTLGSLALLCLVSAFGWAKTEGGLEWYWKINEKGETVEKAWWIPSFIPYFDSKYVALHIPLSRANLVNAHLTVKPKDWLDFEDWKIEYTEKFRKREGLSRNPETWLQFQRQALASELEKRWESLTRSLDKLSLARRDLRGAIATGAFMVGANLSEARMSDAWLPTTRLDGAYLLDTDLNSANLSWAHLEGATLAGANLEWAEFDHASMEGANLGAVKADFAHFNWANLNGAKFTIAQLSLAKFIGARLNDADFNGAEMYSAELDNAEMRRARLQEAEMLGADLQGAELEEANFWRANLEQANLSEAQMYGARLDSANLKLTTLGETSFRAVSIRRAFLRDNSDFNQEQANSAFGDAATRLWPRISMPDHWDCGTIQPWDEDKKLQKWIDAGAPPGKPRETRCGE